MRIAVLMSTYNGHDFLDEQLESLANQTVRENMTVYIRDDGSKDDTFEIINNWKRKLDLVLYKGKNVGPAKSFWELMVNTEIKADYYAFCDQDDVWDANKLEKAVNKLSGSYVLYACNCRIIDENGVVTNDKRARTQPIISIPRLFVSGFTQGCSMVFTDPMRQTIISRVIKCIPMHDIVLALHALDCGDILWDSDPHFSYRVHSKNVVAKDGKSPIKSIKTTYWNWKNSSQHSMADVAKELLENCDRLSQSDKEYLSAVSRYKGSIGNKRKIMFDKRLVNLDRGALRSYRMRILLNLY